MNLREYAEGKYALYAEFAKTISRIVRVSIEKANVASRLQAIQVRAKEAQSLRKKLEARGLLASDEIESQIKDLAGCRLIFYTNNDVNIFLSSRLLVDNFDVDWDKSKIHEPLDKQQPDYVATHYVVALKKDRLALPEYEAFAGLQCEMQIQSILNHAWAETSHDITYKKPTISGFGSKQFESIERRMQKIMTDHLLPAGYEFQKIQQDFEKLLQGQELVGAGGLDRLATCLNNNDRFELLERFHDYVLPQYDDVAATFPGIRRQLIQAIQDARKATPASIETPFGEFPGKSSDDITDISLNILERLRYVDVDNVFSALCELYVGKKTDAEGERILKSVEGLAEHNLDVWRMAGPFVQSRICARVAALAPAELDALLPVVVKALSQVLSAEAESTSSTYSALTLRRAPVQPSDSLAQVRSTAIELLSGMYSAGRTEQQRRMILSALWQATDVPHLGRSHDDLDLMILGDAVKVVTFLLGIVDGESFEVIQHIEHQAFWLFKRYKKWADEGSLNEERSRASSDLLHAVEALRDRI